MKDMRKIGGDLLEKTIRSICIVIMAILLFAGVAFANSGPVFWQGYPSSESLLIKEGTPMVINHEKLVFDFLNNNSNPHYTIGGRVTATYQMYNPTDEKQTLQMAFPFVTALDSLSTEDLVIMADDEVVPYDIYLGDVVDNSGSSFQEDEGVSFDFQEILNTITNKTYEAESFEENEVGKLYNIYVEPTTDQEVSFAITFDFDDNKTKVITKGFNSYEGNHEKVRITARCYHPKVMEIYVLGEDIDLEVQGYKDGALEKKTDLFNYEISSEEIAFRQYLMRYIHEMEDVINNDGGLDTQRYNMYAKALDQHFQRHGGYSAEDSLMVQKHSNRIITLVYTVTFPEKTSKEVSVSYNISGTMDRRKTAYPLYTFDYIFSPAKNWGDFGNLDIEIITPPQAPYVVESSLQLINKEDGLYTASLTSLPEEDFRFSLYEKEKITLLDEVQGNLQIRFGYFTPVVLGGVLLFATAGIITFVYKRRRY